MRFHRTILLVSTITWFMVGLHVPALHQVTHHDSGLPTTVLIAIATLIAVGVLSLGALLRAARRLESQ